MASPPTLLTVVIPVYNECHTWRELVSRVSRVELEGVNLQIILVDDGSTDGTREQLQSFERERTSADSGPTGEPKIQLVVIYHARNAGKGAALRTGFAAAKGDCVIVQDADLEYDPADYPNILAPLLAGQAQVVYGSRFTRGKPEHSTWRHYLANRFLTRFSNWTTGLRLTDMETCYKAFRREVIQAIGIEQDRFGFEPEITAKIARMKLNIVEVPIRYVGRTKAEGKKIGLKDGLDAIKCIWKYRPSQKG